MTPSTDITRRNFMKKTALTAGAVTLLAQGSGFAVMNSGYTTDTTKCIPHDPQNDGTEYLWNGAYFINTKCSKCGSDTGRKFVRNA